MIPILKESLSVLYNTQCFFEEFPSGLGVADLLLAKNVNYRSFSLDDYEAMYYLNNYFSHLNKKICFDDTIKSESLNKKKAMLVLKFLRELGLIKEEYEKGNFFLKSLYKPATGDIYSIEAKLKDWKGGIFQASRNTQFSHKAFVAIDESFLHRVDNRMFEKQNIGLISVSDTRASIIFDPIRAEPKNTTAFYCFSERLLSSSFNYQHNTHN